MLPLLLAFAIVEIIDKTTRGRAPLDIEAAVSAILARYPESGAIRHKLREVLREEAVAAGVLSSEPANG